MHSNLDSKYNEIFNDFEYKIASLDNINAIIREVNFFSKSISVIDIINHLLYSLSEDKYYVPNNSLLKKITLFTSNNYEFSLVHNQPEKSIASVSVPLYTYTSDVFLCPLVSIPDSKYVIYEQKQILSPDVLDTEAILRLKTKKCFTKNDAIYLKKFKDILSYDRTKPSLFLMISSKKSALKYSWEYNSTTLKPTRIVLRNLNIARLGATAKILANIGNMNSKPLLMKLSQHESHMVRWEAARAMINIDFDEGSLMLHKMIFDPHEELRFAARESIEILNTQT